MGPGDSHHPEHASSSSVGERGGRSVSRERGAPNRQQSAAVTPSGRSKLNGLDLLDEDTEAGPAISSADIDQLMMDFDLNDPMMEPEVKPAEPPPPQPPKEEVKEEKPTGLAGALPGGLGAGLSGLPNPMGKLGDLAAQNPVTDVMSKGKDFLFKKFGL